MKNFLFLILTLFFSTGCIGEQVYVGSGQVGKVVSSDGLENNIIKTSSFRLDACPFSACPYLVRMQTTKSTQKITIEQVFLNKSKIDLKNVEVSVQFRVRQDEKSINTVFKEARPEEGIITQENIWKIYLERKTPAATVGILRNASVDDILSNIPEIEKDCENKLKEETKDLPIEITDFGFPNGIGDIPEKVINSYRALYAVEADKQKQIKQLQADLEVEKQSMAIQRVRAGNDKEIATSLGLSLKDYMQLKIDEKYSDAVITASHNNQPFALGSFQAK